MSLTNQQKVLLKREKLIRRYIPKLDCVRAHGDETMEVLGNGSAGTVFLACEDVCVAIKIQVLLNKKHMDAFDKEVKNQRAFAPYAPKVLDTCTEKIGKYTFGVIIMELLKTDSELDKYLMLKRSKRELNDVIEGLNAALEFTIRKRITHGDLAFFNIAQNAKGKWIFLDFDRSSTSVFAPHVDYLRLRTELYARLRSTPTKKMNKSNIDYLLKTAIPIWTKLYKYKKKFDNIDTLGEEWEKAYEKYCVRAHVKCLE
jgi:hypothetical protein